MEKVQQCTHTRMQLVLIDERLNRVLGVFSTTMGY